MYARTHQSTDIIFGLFNYCSRIGSLDRISRYLQCFDLTLKSESEDFWISQLHHPQILMIEVSRHRSLLFTQQYLTYWRSFNIPIIWLISEDLSYQALKNEIYYELTQNVSPVGETILDFASISIYSIHQISHSLLQQMKSKHDAGELLVPMPHPQVNQFSQLPLELLYCNPVTSQTSNHEFKLVFMKKN